MNCVNKNILDIIGKYIEENRDCIIGDLLKLLRIPSVQSEPEKDAPFGMACRQILDETKKLYESYGFESRISSDFKYLLSFSGGKGKTIGLFAHGDVVPVDEDWLICKPFEPIIKDGYIFGRGCHDDKAGIIQSLYAAKVIKDLNFPFKSRLLMMTGSNEETGMSDVISFREHEAMPDFCLVLDAEYPYYSGEKSSMKLDLISKNKLKTIKRIYGGKSYTTVLGKVTAEIEFSDAIFEELRENCSNNPSVVFEKTGKSIFVTATGIPGHVAHIEKTINAMVNLSEILTKCNSIPKNEREMVSQIGSFVGDGYGIGFGIDNTDNIFGKLTCGNGFIRTEEGRLVFGIDIRAGLTTDLKKIKEQIIKVTENDWNVDFKRASDGYYVDPDLPLPKAISDVYETITGESEIKPILSTGGTYSRWLESSCSIGTEVDIFSADLNLPKGHGEWHQPDEKLSIEGFLSALKILVCLLLEIDNL